MHAVSVRLRAGLLQPPHEGGDDAEAENGGEEERDDAGALVAEHGHDERRRDAEEEGGARDEVAPHREGRLEPAGLAVAHERAVVDRLRGRADRDEHELQRLRARRDGA